MRSYPGLPNGHGRRLLAATAVMALGLVMGAGSSMADDTVTATTATDSTATATTPATASADVPAPAAPAYVPAPAAPVEEPAPAAPVDVPAPAAPAAPAEGTAPEAPAYVPAPEAPADVPAPVAPADEPAPYAPADVTAPAADAAAPPASQPETSAATYTPYVAKIRLVKTATLNDASENRMADEGETIRYSFQVTNIGTVKLTAVAVSDPKIGSVTCLKTTLAAGASTSCTAASTYTVTQGDVERQGVISNTATVEGTRPSGGLVSDSDTATVPVGPVDEVVTVDPNVVAGISLVKTASLADTNGNGLADAGETISYSFVVTNTGFGVLRRVAVTDPTRGPVTCLDTTLAHNASTSCTAASYTVTANDVATLTVITNTATVVAVSAYLGVEVSDTDTATVPLGKPPVVPPAVPPVISPPVVLGVVQDAPLPAVAPAAAPAAAELALTGAELVPMGLSGLFALMLGAGLMALSRRPSPHPARR